MNKFLAGLVLGVAAGAAAALFLQSEKGKEVISDIKDAAGDAGAKLKSKVKQFVDDLEEDTKEQTATS